MSLLIVRSWIQVPNYQNCNHHKGYLLKKVKIIDNLWCFVYYNIMITNPNFPVSPLNTYIWNIRIQDFLVRACVLVCVHACVRACVCSCLFKEEEQRIETNRRVLSCITHLCLTFQIQRWRRKYERFFSFIWKKIIYIYHNIIFFKSQYFLLLGSCNKIW